MADNDSTSLVRWMPCLMTRLTDTAPQNKKETLSERRELGSSAVLRTEILKNIETILNSRSHPTEDELGRDSVIKSSVLAFGLSDYCGLTRSEIRTERLLKAIADQIRYFEPRLDPNSIRVTLQKERIGTENFGTEIDILISGRICVKPFEESIYCLTRLDLELGRTQVELGAQ